MIYGQIISHKSSEAQLYEDLLYDYNKIPRPVKNSSEVLIIYVGASLIRIIDVVCFLKLIDEFWKSSW